MLNQEKKCPSPANNWSVRCTIGIYIFLLVSEKASVIRMTICNLPGFVCQNFLMPKLSIGQYETIIKLCQFYLSGSRKIVTQWWFRFNLYAGWIYVANSDRKKVERWFRLISSYMNLFHRSEETNPLKIWLYDFCFHFTRSKLLKPHQNSDIPSEFDHDVSGVKKQE